MLPLLTVTTATNAVCWLFRSRDYQRGSEGGTYIEILADIGLKTSYSPDGLLT